MRIHFEDDPENDRATMPDRHHLLIVCIGLALAALIASIAYLELADPMFL
jgi:hypothetical protein